MNPIVSPLIPFFGNPKVFLKAENLQPFGSYKIRGVLNYFKKNVDILKERGVIAASAGNMAQPIVYFANSYDVDHTIVVPESAPQTKLDALRRLNANMDLQPFEKVWQMVADPSETEKLESCFIHPALSSELLEGYGVIADEILHQLQHLNEMPDAIVIPFGVGGLFLGVAEKMRKTLPRVRLIAAEVMTAAPLSMALKAGKPMMVQRTPSFVDAIGTATVVQRVFDKVQNLVNDTIVVPLEQAQQAVAAVYHQHRMLIEGAGGVAVAAALKLAATDPSLRIVTVVSGGNIDKTVLSSLLN